MPVMDYLHNTVGVSERIQKNERKIAELAKENGINQLRKSVAANTLDAHRLIKLAATKGLDSKVMQLLSKAYFERLKIIAIIKFN